MAAARPLSLHPLVRFVASPRMVLLLAWSMAIASVWTIGGLGGWLVGGAALFGLPAAWLGLQLLLQSRTAEQSVRRLPQLQHHHA